MSTLTRITENELELEIKNKGDQFSSEEKHENFIIIAFDEGRTLPNLLGCLLSRRFPVHASES